jgi:hypothetical protein
MGISRETNGIQADSKENYNMQLKKETRIWTLTVKMEGAAYSSRERKRPRLA